MRILMINHEFTITGASMIFLALAEDWRARGHMVAILPCNPEAGPISARYEAAGIPILPQAALGTAAASFDVAIANTTASAGALLALPPGLPVIWYLHEAEIGLRILSERPQWQAAFARAAAIIYNMPYQAEVFRSYTFAQPAWKFHIIPFGVEIDHQAVDRVVLPKKRHALRIVQIGSIEPRKRPGDLIQAVAMTGLDAECVLCGRFYGLPPEAAALVAQAPERFRVLPEMPHAESLAWQKSADIVALVSLSESQPLTVQEAARLARPMVLTDLACYDGVFRHGVHCLMAPPASPAMIALAIASLAANPRLAAELGEAAARAAASFTRRGFFARMAALLEAILPDGAPAAPFGMQP
ncbi:glycosyltransferase family 4 protein [Acidisoma sp. C75]